MKKESVTFVLFGGTGDLTTRKLVPAFAKLIHEGKIKSNSRVIGVSRGNYNDDSYKNLLISGVANKEEKGYIKKLKIKYLNADFSKEDGLKGLQPLVSVCEPGHKCSRIYYLSTGFRFFPNIVKELKRYGLDDKSDGFTRVVFEKPFGKDLRSSNELDKKIHKVFYEKDVYRIDHYLGKETVQNINILKFTNPIFYSTFCNEFVESIEIIADEKLGVGNRLGYYNWAGAVKDMIQSHLLQMLSLTLMEKPKDLTPKSIQKEKVSILKRLEVLNSKFGRYKSYNKEIKKAGLKEMETETFVQAVLNCKTKRWNGVDLILRSGKKLDKKLGNIIINMKSTNNFGGLKGVKNNKIIIGIYPKQDVDIIMNSSSSECSDCVSDVKFEFCKECKFGPNTSNEYAVLLGEIIKGDKTLFTSSEEVKESWKIAENILKKKRKVIEYKDYSKSDNLIK